MEFIIPLFLLFILSVVAASSAAMTTRKWVRGRVAAIVLALVLPGLYVAYVLGVSHLRDDYHRRRLETYNFDGNCVVALGNGYKLAYYDEFPKFSTLTLQDRGIANNYNDNGTSVRLLEDGVQRIGETNTGVYGAASGRNDFPGQPVDHYFFVSYVDGSDKRFKSEGELREAAHGFAKMSSPDELFSMRESKERSSPVTWILFGLPLVLAVFAWRWLRHWSVGAPNNQSLVAVATQG